MDGLHVGAGAAGPEKVVISEDDAREGMRKFGAFLSSNARRADFLPSVEGAQWVRSRAQLVGRVVAGGAIAVDPKKRQQLRDLCEPTSLRGIVSLRALANYLGRW